MSNRIIFRIKHNNECLAYLYQNWGCGDGKELEKFVHEEAVKYSLDLTKRADSIQAVRLAGERLYGHAIWTATDDVDNPAWTKATVKDLAYLEEHRENIIADNQSDSAVFFYGTYEDYPKYIEEWCEDAYTMNV